MWQTEHTIVALASASGGAPRGIVRLSGFDCLEILSRCIAEPTTLSIPARATRVLDLSLRIGEYHPLPCRAYIWNTVASFTRQPTVELHTIGSTPLLERLIQKLCEHGAQLAKPGEFTLRAFLAGRIDLTQAEGVLGVIEAQTDHELQVALRQLAGGLASPLLQMKDQLLNLLADLEAELDFVEEDIEFVAQARLLDTLEQATREASDLLTKLDSRQPTASRFRVVLYGPPNAGKSSLFNLLTSQGQAIVSPIAGTTRDYLTADCDFAGVPCTLLDTAGFEGVTTSTSIESCAQRQLAEQRSSAHVRLLCLDGSQPLDAWSQHELQQSDAQRIILQTKSDLPHAWQNPAAHSVSTATQAGCETLRHAVAKLLQEQALFVGEVVGATAVRCRESLAHTVSHLEAALQGAQSQVSREFIAGDLRLVLDSLGLILGTVVTDDILDRIFSRFCIGK